MELTFPSHVLMHPFSSVGGKIWTFILQWQIHDFPQEEGANSLLLKKIIIKNPFYLCNTGPSKWADNSPICGQSSQSPVDIELDDVKYDSSLNAFTFTGYESLPTGAAYSFSNNGHGGK